MEDSLYTALTNKLKDDPLKFFWSRNDISVYTIGKGITQDVIQLSGNKTPTRIYVGLLGGMSILTWIKKSIIAAAPAADQQHFNVTKFSDSDRYLGSYKLNPYKFSSGFGKEGEEFSLQSLDLKISNATIDGWKTDIDQNLKGEYLKFLKSLTHLSPSGCPNISYKSYVDNTCFHVFDLVRVSLLYL